MEILNLKDNPSASSSHSFGSSADSSPTNPSHFSDSPVDDSPTLASPGLKFSKNPRKALNPLEVTDLRVAARDNSRVNVFLGGKFAFSLTLAQVTDLNVKIGDIYTEEELKKIRSASDFGKLFQRSLEYALARPRSEKEMRDYLKRKKSKRELEKRRFDEFKAKLESDPEYRKKVKELRFRVRKKNQEARKKDFTEDNRFEYSSFIKTNLPTKPAAPITEKDIENVIRKLVELKIVDDKNFARFFVENRNRLKGTSEKKLRLELKNKGISDIIISEVLAPDEFGEKIRSDKIEIKKIIEKKRRRGYDDKKLTGYLLRQGFPYDLIRSSLNSPDSLENF